MFAPSPSLLRYLRPKPICHPQCQFLRPRCFSSASPSCSGHSRWSKIKHDKAKADMGKNKKRSILAHEIELSSRFYGPDPNANPRLKTALSEAKRQGFPKESIEAAIRRGQGLSTSGKPLETVTVEAVFPPGVASVIECLTDSKLRTLADVRNVITKNGGQASPTQYLFERKGKVRFKAIQDVDRDGVSGDEIMEFALEMEGFEDLDEQSDEEDGGGSCFEVTTEPNATKAVADALVERFELEVESLEIEWQPHTEIEVGGEDVENLEGIIGKLRDLGDVKAVYLNAIM